MIPIPQYSPTVHIAKPYLYFDLNQNKMLSKTDNGTVILRNQASDLAFIVNCSLDLLSQRSAKPARTCGHIGVPYLYITKAKQATRSTLIVLCYMYPPAFQPSQHSHSMSVLYAIYIAKQARCKGSLVSRTWKTRDKGC